MGGQRATAQKVHNCIERHRASSGKLPDASEIVATTSVSEHQAEQLLEAYRYIEQFVGATSLSGRTLVRGCDPPDYVLDCDTGIEITAYHDPARRGVEAAWEKLTKALHVEARLHTGMTGVGVNFCFRRWDVPSRKAEHRAFVRETYQFILSVRTSLCVLR